VSTERRLEEIAQQLREKGNGGAWNDDRAKPAPPPEAVARLKKATDELKIQTFRPSATRLPPPCQLCPTRAGELGPCPLCGRKPESTDG
jgi:hypothetical protein